MAVPSVLHKQAVDLPEPEAIERKSRTAIERRPRPSSARRRRRAHGPSCVRPHRLVRVRSTTSGRIRSARRAIVARDWSFHRYFTGERNDLAAAIAFNALVALVPTFLLAYAVAGLLFRRQEVYEQAIGASLWALPSQSAREALREVLSARERSGWVGFASLIGFAWIGSSFVTALARAMNRIYGVPSRKMVHERVRGFVLIVGFGVLLAAAAIAAALPTLFVGQDTRLFFEDWVFASTIGQVVSYLVSLTIAVALFATLYRIVPNAGQRTRTIWRGALFAAVGFLILAQAFPIYIRVIGSLGIASTYSQAFLFVSLLVTWFFLLAHLLLFGTWINASQQAREHQRASGHEGAGSRR